MQGCLGQTKHMTDKYAVIGNPISHSKSPQIHTAFARQTGQDIQYERLEAGLGLNEFKDKLDALRKVGYKGVNVTVPFKFEALDYAREFGKVRPLAATASAVNTLLFEGDKVEGDNTDGVGLVRDIEKNLSFAIHGKRVLLLGAGGAAFGVLQSLLDARPLSIVIANRTFAKAEKAAAILSNLVKLNEAELDVTARQFDQLDDMSFDLLINSTSTGLTDTKLPINDSIFAENSLAYEMMYGRETPFLAQARAAGAQVSDGLGMLVEQAAEAFYIWRCVMPVTKPVIELLRNSN